MDPISITTLVLSLVTPYIQKIAGKLAEKTVEALPEATGKIWDMVKEKMEAQPGTKSLPADLAKKPDDPMVQGAFQYQLKQLLENDKAFARQLEKLAKEAKKQAAGANVVGGRGVSIGGAASGNIIVTGDKNAVNSENRKRK